MLKKVLSLTVALIIIILCSACSKNVDHSSDTSSEVPASSTQNKSLDSKDNMSKVRKVDYKELKFQWEVLANAGDGLISFQDPTTQLWGYCDYQGKVVLDAQYATINAFSDGYAVVGMGDGKIGQIIDKTGKLIYTLPLGHSLRYPFTKNNDYAYIDGTSNSYLIDKSGNKVKTVTGTIDKNFNVIDDNTSPVFQTSFKGYFFETLVFDKTEKYGFFSVHNDDRTVNLAGSSIKNHKLETIATGAQIQSIMPEASCIGITDDYIAVSNVKDIPQSDFKTINSGLLDYNLKTIISFGTYRFIYPIDKEHIIVITEDMKYGLVNSKNEFLINLSENIIYLLDDEPDHNKTNSNLGWFRFKSEVNTPLYHDKLVNKSGENYILIQNEKVNHSSESYKVYDLDQNKVIRTTPVIDGSHDASFSYLLPEFTMTTGPNKCYDFEGVPIINTVIDEEHFRLEEVSIEPETLLTFVGYDNKNKLILVTEE